MDGIDLKFTKGALETIAETALKIGTGARALRCVIEKVMRDVMFDAPSRKTSGTKEFVVTEPLVNNKITQFLNVG
jgi:ATP-dependent Clp protease ATP-binding subunit ClpX